MSGAFVKIYATILDSSIWLEPAPTRLLWITMLAMADRDGIVRASVRGLAHRANVDLGDCTAALETLAAPDADSKSAENEGRRIERLDGGWLILNYERYRELRTGDQIAATVRQRRKRQRDKSQKGVTVTGVTTEAEAEGEAEAIQESSLSPAREETDAVLSERPDSPDPAWPQPVMQFLQRRGDGLLPWTSALLGMLQGLGAPGGRAVTVEQIAQACIEIEQLGGEISPRRFRRVLEQVTEPTSSRVAGAGSDDVEFVAASNRLQEIASHRDPVRSQTLSAEGWKIVAPAERAAIKVIGGMERVLTAKPDQWSFVVRDYLKATRGSATTKARGKKPATRPATPPRKDSAEFEEFSA